MYIGSETNSNYSYKSSYYRKDVATFFYMDDNISLKCYQKAATHQEVFSKIRKYVQYVFL